MTWVNLGYYQTNWAGEGEGIDLSQYNTMSFQVCQSDNPKVNEITTNFSFVLVDRFNNPIGQPLGLSSFAQVVSPVGLSLLLLFISIYRFSI